MPTQTCTKAQLPKVVAEYSDTSIARMGVSALVVGSTIKFQGGNVPIGDLKVIGVRNPHLDDDVLAALKDQDLAIRVQRKNRVEEIYSPNRWTTTPKY